MSTREPTIATPTTGTLCGRSLELAELQAALDGAARGRGRLVALTGAPGIGKTRLAEATAELGRAEGALVLWGPCWEGGGAPAYWPWVQVLRGIDRAVEGGAAFAEAHRPWLGRLAPELAGGVTPADADLASDQARFALFDAVASTLRAAAAVRPLVVVLDDLHAADRASVLLLEFAARALVDAGVVLVGTWRDEEAMQREDLRPVLAGLARAGTTLPLRGLDRRDLGAFVALRGGAEASEELVTAVHLATEGNPFYVDEVLRLLAAEGRLDRNPPGRIPLPDGVRDAVARRLSPLPDDVRELLVVAAVIGREFRAETVAGAAGLDPGDVIGLLDRAIAHGAVEESPDRLGRFRFRHALVMEVLYDGLSAVRRAGLHRAVGETLERTYAGGLEPHLAELAHHFVNASPPGDAGKAIDYARRAGARAIGVLAHDEAVAFLERAVRLLDLVEPDQTLRAELMLELGRAQTRSGATAAARTTLVDCAEVARAAGLPRRFCEAVLELGAVGLPAGVVDDEMVALLEEALELLDPQPSPLRARALARLAVALYWEPTSGTRRAVLAAEAERMARAVGDPQTLGTVLGQVHLAIMGMASIEDEDRLHEMEALVRETGDRELDQLIRLWWVQCTMQQGRLVEARSRMRSFTQLARKLHQPRLLWYSALYDAIEAAMDARWEDAEAARARAIDIGTRVPGSFAISQTAANLFVDRWAQGDLAELAPAAEQLAQALPLMGTWQSAAALANARGGDMGKARAELRALAVAPDVGLRPRDVLWLVGLALLADAAASADVPELGAVLVGVIEPEAAAGRHVYLASAAYLGPMTRYLGLARLAAGDAAGAVVALTEAEAELERLAVRGWLPAVRRDLARARELAGPAPAAAGRDQGVLRCEGDIWTISLDGRTVRLRDSRGLQLLAELLSRPGEEVHALELVGGAGGRSGFADGGLPVLDDAARRAYRARADELREELDEAERFHDPVRAERARDELDALAEQLAGAVGLGGRARTTGDDAERARVNATRAIRTALKKLAEHDERLGAELDRTVRTGMACAHVPADVRWTVERVG